MNSEYNRLQSFHLHAPRLEKLEFIGSPANFAYKGFYWDNNASEFRCAFCNFSFSLSSTVPSDQEKFFENQNLLHIEKSKCPYMRKSEDSCENIPLYEHPLHRLIQEDPRLEVVRIRSFHWIPNQSILYPEDHKHHVAKEGLYYNPRARAICCAFCPFQEIEFCSKIEKKFKLKECQYTDYLIKEHETCSNWIDMKRKDQNNSLSKLGIVMPYSCPLLKGRSEAEADRDIRSWIVREFENVPVAKTDSLCIPEYPEMESSEKRYKSFFPDKADVPVPKPWPHNTRWIRDLFQCGFFFRHVHDFVTCYWCGVTLGNWKAHNYVFRFTHFLTSPQCRVALLMVDLDEMVSLTSSEDELVNNQRLSKLQTCKFEKMISDYHENY